MPKAEALCLTPLRRFLERCKVRLPTSAVRGCKQLLWVIHRQKIQNCVRGKKSLKSLRKTSLLVCAVSHYVCERRYRLRGRELSRKGSGEKGSLIVKSKIEYEYVSKGQKMEIMNKRIGWQTSSELQSASV